MKYRQPGETFRDAMNRVASALTRDDQPAVYHQFREMLIEMRFMPAGRVQSSIGASRDVTPYNCYVSGTIPDSFVTRDNEHDSSIMHRAEQAAQTMRMGGGIGYDFSTLRPSGALIKKLQSHSSGPLAFMRVFDAVCRATASAGHRRGAQMGVLRVDHPDIVSFITAKHDQDTLSGFNISVAVTDEFMEAVARRSTFTLRFGGQEYQEIDAVELWETIMRSTWDWAEPGVLFIDTINRMNNLWYAETIAATNPCVTGETEILTRAGWQRIDGLVGQRIDVWNGHQWSEVEPRITGENQPLLSVSLSDGSVLECTPYHKFILADGRRVEARELRSSDRLMRFSYPIVDGGERVADAYEQGFFQGDGWFDQRGRAWIGLWGSKKDLLSEFDAQKIYEYPCSGYEGTDTTQTSLRLYLGKGSKRPKGFVPDTTWDVQSRLEWLAGLADSDGCVKWNSEDSVCIQISAKDYDFCHRVIRLLATLGVHSSLAPMKDCWRFGVRSSDLLALQRIGFRTRRLKITKNNPNRAAAPFVRVVSVEDGGIADKVYCFTEHHNHSAVFGGVYTAQCGEQPLPPHGACLLGSFNLARYISGDGRTHWFDWDQLEDDVRIAVRCMDQIVDVARYPLAEQAREAKSKRRMGLGVCGLANAAETLGHPYGSAAFLSWEGEVLQRINRAAYRASARLAAERGTFPLYDAERYLAGQFIQSLDDETHDLIRKHGIRNSHLTSIAPTGTISMCADNVSSGIEPVFSAVTQRPVNTPDGPVIATMRDYALETFGTEPRVASEVTAQQHVQALVVASQHVDSAVSKTCNVDGRMPWAEFKGLYLSAYEGGAKGATTFNADGKRMALLTGKSSQSESTKEEDRVEACVYDPNTGTRTCE